MSVKTEKDDLATEVKKEKPELPREVEAQSWKQYFDAQLKRFNGEESAPVARPSFTTGLTVAQVSKLYYSAPPGQEERRQLLTPLKDPKSKKIWPDSMSEEDELDEPRRKKKKRASDTNIYPCDDCSYTGSQSSLWRHKKNKHEGVRYDCDECDFSSARTSSLKEHVENIHQGVRYECEYEQCSYEATTKTNLRTHERSQHEGVTYPCDQCQYQASSTSHLKSHVQAKHEGIKYSCEQCPCSYQSLHDLHKHQRNKHEQEQEQGRSPEEGEGEDDTGPRLSPTSGRIIMPSPNRSSSQEVPNYTAVPLKQEEEPMPYFHPNNHMNSIPAHAHMPLAHPYY